MCFLTPLYSLIDFNYIFKKWLPRKILLYTANGYQTNEKILKTQKECNTIFEGKFSLHGFFTIYRIRV